MTPFDIDRDDLLSALLQRIERLETNVRSMLPPFDEPDKTHFNVQVLEILDMGQIYMAAANGERFEIRRCRKDMPVGATTGNWVVAVKGGVSE